MTAQVNWVINSMSRILKTGGVQDVEWSCIGRDSVDTTASVTNSSNTVLHPMQVRLGSRHMMRLLKVMFWGGCKRKRTRLPSRRL